MRLTCHCKRHDGKIAFKFVLLKPPKVEPTEEGKEQLFDTLPNETGYSTVQKLSTAMLNRERSKSRTREMRAGV